VNVAAPAPRLDRILVLVGPTAVGKSEVALELASQLSGEIVSVDSMQVYRGMDIGTAKPSQQQRSLVTHHLIDVVDVDQAFDAAQWAARARTAIDAIVGRGKIVILCGGTGLYLRALFAGLGEAPAPSATLRAELSTTPLPDLLRQLEAADPETYARIDRQNPRRVVRAVEVLRLTGAAFSAQRADWKRSEPGALHWPAIVGLLRDRADLVERIDRRVEAMFRDGLVAETEGLLKTGLADNPTALQALGYRQVAELIQGMRSLEETVRLVKIRTRQYAKRQMTWFRRQAPVEWIRVEPLDSAHHTAAQVVASWNARRSPTN
jgi:tRNA dimethylallyltransferase